MTHTYSFSDHELSFSSDLTQILVTEKATGAVTPHTIPNGSGNVGLELRHANGDIILTEEVSFGSTTRAPRVEILKSKGDCAKFSRTSSGGGLVIGIGDVRFSVGSIQPSMNFQNNYSNAPIIFVYNIGQQRQYLIEDPTELDSAPC